MSKQHLLITGIPGTGKTTIGDYLAAHYAFTHINREDFENWPRYYQIVWRRSKRMFARIITLRYDKLVISWGFNPKNDLAEVHLLIDHGMVMVWFEGNRNFAKKIYLGRGATPSPAEAFDMQLAAIEELDLSQFPHVKLEPFSKDGMFRSQEDIVRELLV